MDYTADKPLGIVLFVDDKSLIVEPLPRVFEDAEFAVLTAQSGPEALEVLRETPVELIVADYKMPEMNGLELLTRVREHYPNIRRTIGTGYMDELESYRTISDNLVSNYFKKPWNYHSLQAELEHLLRIKKYLAHHELLDTMSQIGTLPTLPTIYQKFMQAVEEGVSVQHIAQIIEADVAVTANIIHLANSAFFGQARSDSLERAIITLGVHSIQSILLILSMKNNFQWTPEQHDLLSKIFLHATVVNFCFGEFYHASYGRRLDRENTSLGLLYDVGMIILLQYFPDRFHQIMEYHQQHPDKTFHECEVELGHQGATHAELGAYLLRWWNFSDKIVELALFHHSPDRIYEDFRPLAKTLQVAEVFSEYLLQQYPDRDLDPDRLSHPALSRNRMEDLASEVYRKIEQQTAPAPASASKAPRDSSPGE